MNLFKRNITTQKPRKTIEDTKLTQIFKYGTVLKTLIGLFSFISIVLIMLIKADYGEKSILFLNLDNYTVGITLVVWAIFIAIVRYLKSFQKHIFKDNSSLLLISFLTIFILILSKLVTLIPVDPAYPWSQYLNPLPIYAFLIAILLNRKIAFFTIIINSILIGILSGDNLNITLIGFMGGIVAVFSAHSITKRNQIFKAGFAIMSASAFMIISLGIINNLPPSIYFVQSLGGILSGISTSFISISLLPLLEYAFKITTDITLLELSDFNHPLLKRLVIEAPGTYHHSLMVGNLSEAAAEEIGANPLLARVAAYFHDIGKLNKPEYFVENAWHEKSRHEDLIPSMSSLIITSHVKDGVDLAKKYKLNKEIIDIIQQHHGTSLVYFFYKRATEKQTENEQVNEQHYRYAGPKPQTKESAIIAIADSIEAASRTLDKPTPSRIESLVKDVINEKIAGEQLDECNLTLKDLHKISDRICRILNATFHGRIKYPENDNKKVILNKDTSKTTLKN